MARRVGIGAAVMAGGLSLALAAPVLAHGDHDARPLARHLAAGPYSISLWQVYPDAGSGMTPHVIVMFDGMGSVPATAAVDVAVDGRSMALVRSATTANGLETMEGVAEGDVVTVTVSDGAGMWSLDALVVPPPPTSMIPMPELIYTSAALTAATAWWMARRTARAWRRTTLRPGAPGFSTGGSMG